MKKTSGMIILFLAGIVILPMNPAKGVYNGTDALNAPNVVSVIKEYPDGSRYGGCSGALIAPRVVG